MGKDGYIRKASHSGSWYTKSGEVLRKQLSEWLLEASSTSSSTPSQRCVKALIAPHAGYSYSGPTAAHAYMHLDPSVIQRVFILGPSHHVYLRACAVSGASVCETPVGPLSVDEAVRAELLADPLFQTMAQRVDEDEHSIEMHLPYVAHLVGEVQGVSIVPILVGSLDPAQEAVYGRILAKYLSDPANLFIVSTDFCHWGRRFQYQPFDRAHGEDIHEYIEWLDRQGMALIEQGDPQAFTTYLRQYRNTICGRHPLGVFLQAAQALREGGKEGLDVEVEFVRYAQSSRCMHETDSSVSYASAVATTLMAGKDARGNGGAKPVMT
ncbi:hypothetical protein NSK_006897 [Nannochloropsis salina CCMP1776]|uniref:Protein MEMO1 n=1 Tax=Nannochloropsis salina CCMP1776 TaxID=1027361 RepID=A0A4D9CS53_9STRA|nr:hypothetical protein NSK_006897 [Nannochloropsis salina CCMP1776]|eukprot:TFJ81646.1 hypothetical protein NSK_006897 [Nannochloropsis salina CCMP1776]